MSFNVQAALCFSLGEPLSAFSGSHLVTRHLVLNLPCCGSCLPWSFIKAQIYQGTLRGKAVVRWSELAFSWSHWISTPCKVNIQRSRTWDLEPGSWDPEPRVFPGTPLLAPPTFGIRQSWLARLLLVDCPLILMLVMTGPSHDH
ncbi:hypothetical protein DY000_02007063 [Brassica cretica]|uniref:Uncharacterized protein n=1 Tax=Brassica cretica TaxID=69181 RepID=A0ABQ7BTS6_BRACR|nr:hypothetical protein DY000_02007063 [Brassica cretica]